MQNDEGSGIATQRFIAPTQSHINTTSKPHQILLIANRFRPQSHHEATLRPPSSHLVANR
jgi:hypothetical protein